MRTVILGLLALSFLVIGGCSHDYQWNEYKITPDRVAQGSFISGQKVAIIKGKSDEAKVKLASMGFHGFYASEAILRDGIVEQLGVELKKKGLVVGNPAGKSLEIAVTGHSFEQGAWRLAANLTYTVKFGDGKTKTYEVRNSSPTDVYHTYDGAIALAVIKVINDPDVQEYLKK